MTFGKAKTMVGLLALVLGAVGACNGRTEAHVGSETNWLAMCDDDGNCDVGHCLCGVCSATCDDAAGCPSGSGLDMCAGSDSAAVSKLCSGASATPKGVCLKSCGAGIACAKGFSCESGACVPTARSEGADASAGTGGVTGEGAATGSGGTGNAGTPQDGSGGRVGNATSSMTTSQFVDEITIGGAGSSGIVGQCLPRKLQVDSDGQATCTIVQVPTDQSSCQCDGPGLRTPTASELTAAQGRLRSAAACDADGKPACTDVCGCTLLQESGSDLSTCQNNASVDGVTPGWCYVDPSQGAGATSIVAKCPSPEQRVLRFVGSTANEQLLIECTGTSQNSVPTSGAQRNIGDPCTPGDEFNPNFSGFGVTEVSIETGTPSCSSGVCLAANFQGRTTCPYGQPADPSGSGLADTTIPAEDRCYLPGAAQVPANAIAVPVTPQLVKRSPADAVYCSCRCDGPAGTAPFCACPSGFECTHLVDQYGTSTVDQGAGSYCLKAGTAVADPTQFDNATECSATNPATFAPRPAGCGLDKHPSPTEPDAG